MSGGVVLIRETEVEETRFISTFHRKISCPERAFFIIKFLISRAFAVIVFLPEFCARCWLGFGGKPSPVLSKLAHVSQLHFLP